MNKKIINDFLTEYSCPLKYSGRTQLVDLVIEANKYYGKIATNMKNVYAEVEKMYNTTRLCLERNLRTLVEVWQEESKFNELFPKSPTNMELVTKITVQLHNLTEGKSAYDILFN
jgi:hypothetical protein